MILFMPIILKLANPNVQLRSMADFSTRNSAKPGMLDQIVDPAPVVQRP